MPVQIWPLKLAIIEVLEEPASTHGRINSTPINSPWVLSGTAFMIEMRGVAARDTQYGEQQRLSSAARVVTCSLLPQRRKGFGLVTGRRE
jgi:hypothetical protein